MEPDERCATVAKLLDQIRLLETEDVSSALDGLRLLASHVPSLSEAAAAAKVLGRLSSASVAGWRTLRIFLAGNCTLKPLSDALALELLREGIVTVIAEGPFDTWELDFRSPTSGIDSFGPGVVVLYLSGLGLTAAGTRTQAEFVSRLETSLTALHERLAAHVVVVLPEPLEEEHDPTDMIGQWRSQIAHELRGRLGDRAVLVDPFPVMLGLGPQRWYAPRFWFHSKMPCHPAALAAMGRYLSAIVARCLHRPIKCVAVDLDNTLWGGTVGEDGWRRLQVDRHGRGGPYVRLQAYLKRLIETGVAVAAVSKNNPEDVVEAFECLSKDLELQWSDFSATYVNWLPKSENIRQLASRLNVDLSAICFLDDQPFEREEVRRALPTVVVPELPSQPEAVVPFLAQSSLFVAPVVTKEDSLRNRSFKEDEERRSAASSMSRESFLRSLNLTVSPLPVDAETLDRVVQLIQKTNQFNLTTRRHDGQAVKRLVESEGLCACYRVSDRFGDNGITGVLLTVPRDSALVIDTWLLSCRVIGREIEKAMFHHLHTWAARHGFESIRGCFIPTPKNAPVARLLPGLGFHPLSPCGLEVEWFEYPLSRTYDPGEVVALVESPSTRRGEA